MPKDDYFRNVYLILKVLYHYKKEHKRVDLEEISPEVLEINEGYRNDILEEMLEEGYIKGFKVKSYICGKAFTGLENIDITPKGIEYLQDNSKMKKMGDILKSVKEITSGI